VTSLTSQFTITLPAGTVSPFFGEVIVMTASGFTVGVGDAAGCHGRRVPATRAPAAMLDDGEERVPALSGEWQGQRGRETRQAPQQAAESGPWLRRAPGVGGEVAL